MTNHTDPHRPLPATAPRPVTGNPVAGWIELPDKNTKANAEPFAMRDLFPIVIELDEVPDNAIRAMVGLPPQH